MTTEITQQQLVTVLQCLHACREARALALTRASPLECYAVAPAGWLLWLADTLHVGKERVMLALLAMYDHTVANGGDVLSVTSAAIISRLRHWASGGRVDLDQLASLAASNSRNGSRTSEWIWWLCRYVRGLGKTASIADDITLQFEAFDRSARPALAEIARRHLPYDLLAAALAPHLAAATQRGAAR